MGLRLFFLTNFLGATFIQGGTFIPDSRVVKVFRRINCSLLQNHSTNMTLFGKHYLQNSNVSRIFLQIGIEWMATFT